MFGIGKCGFALVHVNLLYTVGKREMLRFLCVLEDQVHYLCITTAVHLYCSIIC